MTKSQSFPLNILLAAILLAVLFGLSQDAEAGVFFGPTPYLSEADIPSGFYLGGVPAALENFEDGTLDFGITASAGNVAFPASFTDSVDGDDGAIDGSGTSGSSYVALQNDLTFTFANPVTAAGLVYTDAEPGAVVSFEAFGPGMVSLGLVGPFANLFLGPTTGQTDEDRFFGVQDLGGIIAIRVSTNIANGVNTGIEVDHVQYGTAAPEPSSIVLLCFSTALMLLGRNRKRA